MTQAGSGGQRPVQEAPGSVGESDVDADTAATPAKSSKRGRWLLGLGLVGLVFAVSVLLGAAFGGTHLEVPTEPVDAVVVLGGGGPRFERGVDLVRAGLAEELIVFRTIDPNQRWQAAYALCARWDPVPASCLEPNPSDTRGEAVRLGEVLNERGWDSVVLVVSDDQARRAKSLVRRCAPDGTEVSVVGVQHPHPFPVRALYETLASVRDEVLNPGC